ncbi:MAG: glycosyltransferase family 4 protein [Candidatus Promineifilaceae bacterium]
MKKVLFAHQSTIPHYRIQFYNTLEQLRPQNWGFEVVFDKTEITKPQFFKEPVAFERFQFPILDVNTITTKVAGKRISYQTFWRRAANYDLLIVENAVNNLAYPLCQVHQLRGTKYAYWGHGWDHKVEKTSLPKKVSENLKMQLAKQADGFFAYTPRVKKHLVDEGLSPSRVFVVNNTIDINEQRRLFEQWQPQRASIRRQFGLEDERTLLFVGRFTPNKRIDFLLEAFSILRKKDPAYHLLLVGSGGDIYNLDASPDITYLGPIVEPDQLARVYVAGDIFAFPGSVGLGPLQALCYDLPVVTIDSNVHMPEIEYLNQDNSIILPEGTTAEMYAQTISDLFDHAQKLRDLQDSIWPSIEHLTIEQMALNFIHGINTILAA